MVIARTLQPAGTVLLCKISAGYCSYPAGAQLLRCQPEQSRHPTLTVVKEIVMANLSSYGEASDLSAPAYQHGFQTLGKETSVEALDVEGRIPDWLTGILLRVGPARFEWGPDRYRHWFDGSGMIHKFSFAAGKVGYANRYVRGTSFVENERAGRITVETFATDPCQELFRKGFVHYHATGNANVKPSPLVTCLWHWARLRSRSPSTRRRWRGVSFHQTREELQPH
jgi:hypothetical protein